MYFASKSKYMILGSRFVVGMCVCPQCNDVLTFSYSLCMNLGIGAGAGATLIGELTRTTEVKGRTAVLSVFIGVRQIGLVIGKSVNLGPF